MPSDTTSASLKAASGSPLICSVSFLYGELACSGSFTEASCNALITSSLTSLSFMRLASSGVTLKVSPRFCTVATTLSFGASSFNIWKTSRWLSGPVLSATFLGSEKSSTK